MDIRMRDDGHRLLEALEDGKQVGRVDYFLLETEVPVARVGVHTVVDPAQEGRGIGGLLATEFYRAAAEAGQTPVPLCPYLLHWSGKHPELAPVADPALVERAEEHVKHTPELW